MKKIIFAALVAAMFSSCEDSFYKVNSLDGFSVTTEKKTYKVGERVEFLLSADSDFIVFYSGEEGSDYKYKNQDRLYEDKMLLSFSTATYPDNGTNPRSGRLLWSNDFPGVYEPEWIKMSTWHDITDRIVYPNMSPTTYVLYDTDCMDITDLFEENKDKPIYFCWAFETQANSLRNRFRIDNWRIHGETNPDKEFYSFAQTAFTMVEGQGFDIEPHESYYPRVTDKYVVWDGISKSTVYKDGWAISGPIKYSDYINTGKENGVTIKTIGDPIKKVHNHYFNKPGTYEVVFEAVNANSKNKLTAVAKTVVTIEGEIENTEVVVPIETSADAIEFSSSSTTASFNLRCSANWTITTSDAGITVTPSQGNANDLYQITVTRSEGAAVSSALTIKAGEAEKTITVSAN